MNSDKQIDLTGVKCPLNFVKAKLALEQLTLGQVLEITLDANADSAINVPNSLQQEGHNVLSQVQTETTLVLQVQKQV